MTTSHCNYTRKMGPREDGDSVGVIIYNMDDGELVGDSREITDHRMHTFQIS